MGSGTDRPASQALIATILSEYHEPHRKDLMRLNELVGHSGDGILAATFLEFRALLEMHMFKEEMRAFPMIEQGSSNLLGELAEDLMREHDLIREKAAHMKSALSQFVLADPSAADSELQLRAETFFLALDEHSRIEDDELFGGLLDSRIAHPIA